MTQYKICLQSFIREYEW